MMTKNKLLIGLTLTTLLLAAIPSVNAAISVSIAPVKAEYVRGETIDITISGTTATEDIYIQVFRGSASHWVDQRVASGASYIYTLNISDTWYDGIYTIRVKGSIGGTASTTFVLDAPSQPVPPPFIPPPPAPPAPPAPPTATEIAAMSTSDAIDVIESLDIESAADIMTELTTSKAADILNGVDPETAADILLEMEPEAGAGLVEAMVTGDLNAAALRVEEAVKRSGNTAKLTEFGGTLTGVPAETLVSLFREIAGLPATPSTVAELFEVMDITKVIDIVDEWMATEDYEGLATVFSYLSDAKLEELFLSMTPQDRTTFYPYLDETIQAKLPDVGALVVSDLSITPSTVETGDPVTITVEVSNDGLLQFSEGITLRVDGSSVESEILTLMPGETETVTWTVSEATAGTYSVEVNGLTDSFTVEEPEPAPAPANIVYHSVAVSPSLVEAGNPVTVTVTLDNTGDLIGSETIELYVNYILEDSETKSIVGGGTDSVTFQVTKDTPGTYTVEAGGETATFTVTEAEPEATAFPLTYAVVGVVIIAAAAYMYMQQQNKL